MAEIKEFPTRGGSASGEKPPTERPRPEKPARVIGRIEPALKKEGLREHVKNMGTTLADAVALAREGQLTDTEIDNLNSVEEGEKVLLKIMVGLFEKLRIQDEEIERLRGQIKKLEQKSQE